MIIGNANSTKILRDLELIDADLESKGSISPHEPPFSTSGPNKQLASTRLSDGIFSEFKDELAAAVPWFLENMPTLYHWITPLKEQMDHIVAIVSGRVLSLQQIVERGNNSNQCTTLIAPGANGSAIVALAPRISRFPSAKLLNIFSSLDTRLAIASIYEAAYSPVDEVNPHDFIEKRAMLLKALPEFNEAEVDSYFKSLDVDYMYHATVMMLAIGFKAVKYCTGNENSYVHLTETENSSEDYRFRVDIGLKGFTVTAAVEHIVGILNRYHFSIRRILSGEVRTKDKQQFVVIQVVANQSDGARLNTSSPNWSRVLNSFKTLSYVDHGDEFSNLLQGTTPKTLNEANLIRAVANWVHIFLTKVNPYYYSLDRVSKHLVRHDTFIDHLLSYFKVRFDPRYDDDRLKNTIEISRTIELIIRESVDEIEKAIFKESFNFLQNILKTNYFMVSKGALCFRINPSALNQEHYPEKPFGIFYMMGRDFRGFQVRYRDIARGGVRVVMPRTEADYESALAGLFDEVNGLAYAQQLKNKDIPEGGSKCVFVIRPGGQKNLAVKSAISGLLDLITRDPETGLLDASIVDEYGKEEIIYLGPDENMTDDLIVWTIQHALHRKYQYAYAFMSSKPDFGINHKTYGVTSEGLNVYLDNVLQYLNIHKGKEFRVKMTGGPDGDVAGNELKILYREYGNAARVVAIADGYGAAYDAKGLHWPELLRLVNENKSIVEFNKELLTKNQDSFVVVADCKDNIRKRDTLYAQVEAEIFIPAGGRPYTVRETNWHKYLKSDGKPSSLAIVEGANIFFTPEARNKLVESGAIVIKDSSANKAGVICSSYEIIACLTMTPEEFAQIKSVYVEQVINILKAKADAEAKLLFREWEKREEETDLVKLSYEISKEINWVTDILSERLNGLTDAEMSSEKFQFIIYQHCPNILVEKYKDRLKERLPRAHKIAIMSAYMASHLVYKEGLKWLSQLETSHVYKVAIEYINVERTVERMIYDLSNTNLPDKDRIAALIRETGPRYLACSTLSS